MKTRLSVEQLCAKYRIDAPHAEHVEQTALAIWRTIRAPSRFRAGDDRLLCAACRLHDVAPPHLQANHAERGAHIIRHEGLAGFSWIERAIVAAAVSVHPAEQPLRPAIPLPISWDDTRRAMRLAAILRIADALDHGHLQGTTAGRLKLRGKRLELRTVMVCNPDNTTRARRRANVWRRYLPVGIVISPRDRRDSHVAFSGVVRPGDSILTAARRILISQHIIMRSNLAGMVTHPDPVYLHDFRVAMRRFRVALRVFRSHLEGTGANDLKKRLSHLSDVMGPIRDSQAWMEFLAKPRVVETCASDPDWTAYVEACRADMLQQWDRLRNVCASAEFTRAMAAVRELLRATLPALEAKGPDAPFARFAAKRLWKRYHRLTKLSDDVNGMAAEELHARRKRYRRGRYLTEFAQPVLDGAASKLQRVLKRQTSCLGTVHDVDAHLLTAPAHASPLPRRLRAFMVRERVSKLDRYVRDQRDIESKSFRRAMKSLA